MANPEHLAILKQGVAVWNAWRLKTTELVDLSGAYLVGIDFNRANLSETDLSTAELNGANLTGADLTGADLSTTYLCAADLSTADLRGANISGADFILTDLNNTDFTHVVLGSTVFADVDLSTARGLASTRHEGPSTIGIDTLYKSRGQIPEAFLRGCGVPETFITQAKALIGAEEGIQFYSCFISYSTKDEEFARRLHARLQQEHIRVWFAPHDMKGGEKLHEQIDTAIKVYDKLLILLSHHSLQSDWVKTELRKAYNAERKARKAEGKTGKRKLFPMRLVDYATLTDWECFDSDTGTDLATEVREYFIPDFSNWKDHDAFEAAFARLLKDLRQSTQPAPGV
jgi:hypothetical protein